MSKRTASTGHGSLATGAVTALALAVQTGLAAVVGVLIAQKLGRTAETDGFFAAYGVFIVLALAATAVRVTVLPPLARAREERRLSVETAAYAGAVAVAALPLALVGILAAEPLAARADRLRPRGGARRSRRDAPLADGRGRSASSPQGCSRARSPRWTTTSPRRSATSAARSSGSR